MPSDRKRIKGVIFDLDETLIDTLGTLTEAFNTGIIKFGLGPVTSEKIAYFLDRGARLQNMLLELFPSIFEDDSKRLICEDEIRSSYSNLAIEKVTLKPGAERTLQTLKENGFKTGIVTGRRSEGERKWLELRRLNIHRFVDVMVTAAEAPAKPAPDGLIKCMKELELSADECIFVGDSRLDIMAGKKAGVWTVAVHTGVASREILAEQEPDFILDDLNSFLPYLDTL